MPPCEDWTALPIYSKLALMAATISGRIFVGPGLCNDPVYLESSIGYTFDLIEAQQAIKHIRPILKPFLAPRLQPVKDLMERRQLMTAKLGPEVRRRRDGENSDPNFQKPDDLLQWVLDRSKGTESDTVESITNLQLSIIFAAIHTTTMTATHV